MTVTPLRNQAVSAWVAAQARLTAAVARLPAPRLQAHLATAERVLLTRGPSTRWADYIAAIAVIAQRQADVSTTTAGRAHHLEAATAAYELLEQARDTHGVLPSPQAVAELHGSPRYSGSPDFPSSPSSSGVRNSSTSS